jgi:hypothetical protein
VVTRPTQTPPAEPSAGSNSPQTVDSPVEPAPAVTEPDEDDKKKKEGAQVPPPESPRK